MIFHYIIETAELTQLASKDVLAGGALDDLLDEIAEDVTYEYVGNVCQEIS